MVVNFALHFWQSLILLVWRNFFPISRHEIQRKARAKTMTPQLFPNYLSTRLLLLTLKLEKKIRFYVLTGELAAHSPVQQQHSFFTN